MPGTLIGQGVLEPEDGSTIAAEDAHVPGDLRGVRTDGVGFGPLRLTSWADETTSISDLEFEEAEADSWLPFLSAAGATGAAAHYDREDGEVHDPDRTALSRRAVLATIGASTFLVGSTLANDQPTYSVASFDLEQNRRGLRVDVDEAAADFLEGEDVEFYLSADDAAIGSFELDEPGLTINPGTEGLVELESDTALTFIQRMIASVRSDDNVHFEWRPQDTSFADEPTGEEIVLSDQPVVVETIEAAGESATVIKMVDTIIPHTDENGSKPAGEWYTDGTTLRYVVGEQTPDTSLVEAHANLGRIDRIRERHFG